jgi:hypothetical protein
MKHFATDSIDDLRPEYDLKSLRVRRVSAGRKTINGHKITVGESVISLARM